jgi:hypothetical protein
MANTLLGTGKIDLLLLPHDATLVHMIAFEAAHHGIIGVIVGSLFGDDVMCVSCKVVEDRLSLECSLLLELPLRVIVQLLSNVVINAGSLQISYWKLQQCRNYKSKLQGITTGCTICTLGQYDLY